MPNEPAGGGQGNLPAEKPVYRNPFRGVRNLSPERIDMGVDYGGTGPVYALGPGVITNTYNAGWGPPAGAAPGAFIGEKLTEGPLKGQFVYVAEGINPRVRVGQKVDSSTVIGDLTGGGIETGFAAAPGTGNALGASQFTGANTTAWGAEYSDLLKKLGAPAGVQQNTPTGSVPSWLNRALGDVTGGAFFGGAASNAAGNLEKGASGIAQALTNLEQAIAWLFIPANWVRILCFLAGSGFVIIGLVMMSRTGKSYSVSVPGAGSIPAPGGELAPAWGIAEVTFGAILLFFAFHNLQAMGINTFQDMLGYFRDRAHGQAPQAVG